MKIIIYGSQYGTAKQYAIELSKRTNIEAKSYEGVKNIEEYETIIYIGSLYAGGVLGMKKTFQKISNYSNKKIIIVTVGLADPTDVENTNNIKNSIKKQLTTEAYENALIFHLRGGIDYSRLNLKHKMMMSLLYKKAKSLQEEQKTAEVKAMIETYNKQVNFIDFLSLDKVLEKLNS